MVSGMVCYDLSSGLKFTAEAPYLDLQKNIFATTYLEISGILYNLKSDIT